MLSKIITYIFVLLLMAVGVFAKPYMTIPKIYTPITIDGIVGQDEWMGASSLTGLRHQATKTVAGENTIFWLGYDDKNLYIAYKCFSSYSPVGADLGRGKSYWDDDSMEIFLKPNKDASGHFQIIGNCAGGFTDYIYDGLNTKALDIKYKTNISNGFNIIGAKKEDMYWQGEMVITWESMGVSAPKNGQAALFQISRDHTQGKYISASNDYKTALNDLNTFSDVTFYENIPAVHVNPVKLIGTDVVVYNPSDTQNVELKTILTSEGGGSKTDVKDVTLAKGESKNLVANLEALKGGFDLLSEVRTKDLLLFSTTSRILNVEPLEVAIKNNKLIVNVDLFGISQKEKPTIEFYVKDKTHLLAGFSGMLDGSESKITKEIDIKDFSKGNYSIIFRIGDQYSENLRIDI